MEQLSNLPDPGGRTLSRRTVVAGIAWSVPVIAVASATPAFAASPGIGPITVLPTTWSRSGAGTLTQAAYTGFLPTSSASGHASASYLDGTPLAKSFTSGSDTNGQAATITALYTFNAVQGAKYAISLTVKTQYGSPSADSERQSLDALVIQSGATTGTIAKMTISHSNTQRRSNTAMTNAGYTLQSAPSSHTYTLSSWTAAQTAAVTIQCTFTVDRRASGNTVSDDIWISAPVVNRIS